MISRRGVLQGLGTLIVSGLASAAYGVGIEALGNRVTRYRLTPPGWPADYPLSIAVVTDIHACEPWMGIERIRGIVAETNALGCDIVLLLGDFPASRGLGKYSRKVEPHQWAGELAALRAPLGVHAVLGNHDWWEDAQVQLRRAGPTPAHIALRAVGIPVYENDAVRIAHGGRAFWLAGLGDQWSFWPQNRDWRRTRKIPYEGVDDLPATLAKITDAAPVLLMAHEPDIFPSVPARVSLTLSGHTHGGQVTFAGFAPIVPSRYGSRYLYGHLVEDGRHLIVSRGLGCSGLPIRFGAPPEILRIDLGGAARASGRHSFDTNSRLA